MSFDVSYVLVDILLKDGSFLGGDVVTHFFVVLGFGYVDFVESLLICFTSNFARLLV